MASLTRTPLALAAAAAVTTIPIASQAEPPAVSDAGIGLATVSAVDVVARPGARHQVMDSSGNLLLRHDRFTALADVPRRRAHRARGEQQPRPDRRPLR
jgi:hypothetical protein